MSVAGLNYSLGAAARDRAAQAEGAAIRAVAKVPNRKSQAKKAWWDKKRREAEEAK